MQFGKLPASFVNVAMLLLNEATLVVPIVAPLQFWKMNAIMLGAVVA
jgi:hypothetical protein